MQRGAHYIEPRGLEVAVGVGALLAAAVLLRDAYEVRGRKQPLWLRPLAWW